jgi:uncharacterized protein
MPSTAALEPKSSPPQESGRLVVLDILRGVALLGMLCVHVNLYEGTPLGAEPGRAAALVEHVLGLFFDERFYGIFGMLFGVGFAIQLERSEARGQRFVLSYLRRLAALAVFGIIAEGVFGFNVLLGYAIWGVPLLLVRRWPVPALVALLVVCASSRPLYSITRVAIARASAGDIEAFNQSEEASMLAFQAARDSVRAIERSGRWGDVVAARMTFIPKFHRQFGLLPNLSFTLFLMGLIGWRLGVFTRPAQHRRRIVALMLLGAGCWAMARFVLPFGGPIAPPAPADQNAWTATVAFARYGFQLVREQWLAFTYIGVVLLLVAAGPQWERRLSFFSWAGRLALTNYMTQVILLELLFTSRGAGLKVPAALVFPAAIALFTAQVVFSRWWLSKFRFGPLEWIWRSVTKWSVQPMRIRPEPVEVPLAA